MCQLAKHVVFALAFAAMFAVTAAAADLNGTITYKTLKMAQPGPLSEALVSVYHIGTKSKTVTRTSSTGKYLFKNLPNGSYVILVEKDGQRVYQGKVDVSQGNRQFDIKL